jgi:transcription regulator MmyB-like protein
MKHPLTTHPAIEADLLSALGDVPAIVLGRRSDVLAWNRMGHALLAGDIDPAALKGANIGIRW